MSSRQRKKGDETMKPPKYSPVITILAITLALIMISRAYGGPYTFSMDRFGVVGNLPGDMADEFHDGIVSPWVIYDPTIVESGGQVRFSSPGAIDEGVYNGHHVRSQMSFIGSGFESPFNVANGAGDFTGLSQWAPIVPGQNQWYEMQVGYELTQEPHRGIDISVGVANWDPVYANLFGIPSGLGISFYLGGDMALDDHVWQHAPIAETDITGEIFLRLDFDDDTDHFTAAFSLDGGLTYQSPFAPIGWGMPTPGHYEWYFSGQDIDIQAIPEPSSDCPYDLLGDLNNDCRVDFLDIALTAQNWLVDCNQTAQDPACVKRVEWQINAAMSTERDQFTGGVIDGKIYVFGGNDGDGVDLKSTEMFDPDTGVWTMRADNEHAGGAGVEELTGAVVGEKLYVFGAQGRQVPGWEHGEINFVEEYNPVTSTWRSRAPKPTLVTAAPATVYDGQVYLFAGGHWTTGVTYRVVEAFDPATNNWRSVTDVPGNVQMFALATVGNKAYLIGGYLTDEDRITGEVITFDFKTGQWDVDSRRPMPADRARAFAYSSAAPVIDGKIFLLGGMQGSLHLGMWASNKVDVYDPATNTWHVQRPLPVSVESHLSVVVDDRIYVIGGKMETLRTSFSGRF
jgi:N-acetylneuraminic acid mutarotase